MDPESKKLLEDTFALAKENNSMLQSLRRSQQWATIMSFVYWIFIIGTAIGAFYFIQPYLNQIKDIYVNASAEINSLKNFGH